MIAQLRDLYLDLMENILTNNIYGDPGMGMDKFIPAARALGKDWPSEAHTMIGAARLHNIRHLAESVIADNVPGDFIETEVWRGGACIYMRAILKAHGITDRLVWVADSFQGLPPPDPGFYPADEGIALHKYRQLAVSKEEVQSNFSKYGLLDEQVRFIVGWFGESLPEAPVDRLALMRLDGDLYEPTMDSLLYLYDKLEVGDYIIIDDFQIILACRQAVSDFRAERKISAPIVKIDQDGVYWRKTG